MSTSLKPGIRVIQKGSLYFQVYDQGRLIRFQPWLGDAFAFLYDFSMTHSIFPKKFRADIDRHTAILSQALGDVHGQQVFEIGTGSGAAADVLPPDNDYTGSDISTGLLKRAAKRFDQAGFQNPEFYVASGENLPFAKGSFDLGLCILSLNFIGKHQQVFEGVQAILRRGGSLLCCVPVPERNHQESTIRGRLLSEVQLQKLCQKTGFIFESFNAENGALLYFRAGKSG
jgi:ubiquinone/menaquinone biosynthesis C-methylase UbiE